MKPSTCGSDSGEVDLEVAAALGDRGADRDVIAAVAVVVEDRLAPIDAIRPAGDHRPRLALGAIEDRLDRGLRWSPGRTRRAAPAAGARRRGAEPIMAARSPRKSRGWRTLSTIISSTSRAQPALLVELERRDADALLPDLGGGRVVGAVGGAADVALVRAVDRPEQPGASPSNTGTKAVRSGR